MTHHDALGQKAVDRGLQIKRLPTDNGVWQGELHEEGLGGGQDSRRGQTKTFGGQAKRLRLPRGDVVRNLERNFYGASVSKGQHKIEIMRTREVKTVGKLLLME